MTPPTQPPFTIRASTPDDCQLIVNLIMELAVYEKLETFANATPDAMRTHLFGPNPAAEAWIAEVEGEPAGFALFFRTFSTFRGQPGLYLEDLYVKPERRGMGIGKALLTSLARETLRRGYGRLEWAVLDWNEPAIGFYKSLGAESMTEWTVNRLSDETLERAAALAPAFVNVGESKTG